MNRNYYTDEPDLMNYAPSVSSNYYYYCPDLKAVDQLLADILVMVGPGSNLKDVGKAILLRDFDVLLERRLYLEIVEPNVAEAA